MFFKHTPYKHQLEYLGLTARQLNMTVSSRLNYGVFMDQGTGKTKCVIDDACRAYRAHDIQLLLILAPNSVKENWVDWYWTDEEEDEIKKHMPPDIDYFKAVWVSTTNKFEKDSWYAFEKKIVNATSSKQMIILSVNYDVLSIPRVQNFLLNLTVAFPTFIAADESTFIGNHKSKRTKAAIKIRKNCLIARVMSGTPIVQSPMKIFSQFAFLDKRILGFNSFYSFRNRYAVMGGFEGKQILSYKNLDELEAVIAKWSFRVLKGDCLDLPPKIHMPKRRVLLSSAQLKAYKTMSEEMIAVHERGIVTAQITLTQILRLAEITSGYLPVIDPVDGSRIGTQELVKPEKNPKMQEVMSLLESFGDKQTVIWSRFTPELEGLMTLIRKADYTTARFDGKISNRQATVNRKAFQRGEVQVLVANAAKGGFGIPLYAAEHVIYISNSLSTEHRVQSEDRSHRQGTEKKVCYWDIICPNTVDVKVVRTLRNNKNISDQVMGDGFRSWI